LYWGFDIVVVGGDFQTLVGKPIEVSVIRRGSDPERIESGKKSVEKRWRVRRARLLTI